MQYSPRLHISALSSAYLKQHAALQIMAFILASLLTSLTDASTQFIHSEQQKKQLDYRPYMKKLVAITAKDPNAFFAAMIIDNQSGKVLCIGVNRKTGNPVLHGEIVAINNCAQKYKSAMKWKSATLITTAEPCPMCQGAISWSNLSTVVYGTSIPFLVKNGWRQINLRAYEVAKRSSFNHVQVIAGVLEHETNKLYQRRKNTRKDSLKFGNYIIEKSLLRGPGNLEQKIALCDHCHGKNSLGDKDFGINVNFGTPGLRRLSSDYIEQQLLQFQSNRRLHGEMQKIAEVLSLKDIKSLANHYSALDFNVNNSSHNNRKYNADIVKTGKILSNDRTITGLNSSCSDCHNTEIKPSIAPNLAGQNALYISRQFKAWTQNHRMSAQRTMLQIANKLDAQQVHALSIYYESLGWH